jgi:hypothetical protein
MSSLRFLTTTKAGPGIYAYKWKKDGTSKLIVPADKMSWSDSIGVRTTHRAHTPDKPEYQSAMRKMVVKYGPIAGGWDQAAFQKLLASFAANPLPTSAVSPARAPVPNAAPAPPAIPIDDWRSWAHKAPGDCACGIKRVMCEYHR